MINLSVTPQLAFIESPPQLLLIFFIVFVLFGAKKVPTMARDLGKGIREFKKSLSGESDETDEIAVNEVGSHDQNESITCARCNSKLKSGTKFCSECGNPVNAKSENPVASVEMNNETIVKKDKLKQPRKRKKKDS